MDSTRSADGTEIAFDRLGTGEPVILIAGAQCARATNTELAGLLAAGCTVLNYDRRGRGDSGDTAPYAVEREIEDLDALIAAAGGSASVAGFSSGAVLGLRAAAAGLAIARLALIDTPFNADPGTPRRQREYAARLSKLLAADRRGDAVALFLTNIGMPEEMVAGMRRAPMWPGLEALAHTLAYDAAVMGDGMMPADLVASVKSRTLVAYSTASPLFGAAARALAAALPEAHQQILDGQDHNIDPQALAPVLTNFLRS